MAPTERQLADCKLYMRVDGADEDELISDLYRAAQEYLARAGICCTEDNASSYALAVHSLTLHYYDHRDAVGTEAGIPVGLRPIINQLKLEAEVQAAAWRVESL